MEKETGLGRHPEGLPVRGPRGAPSPPQAPKVQKTLKGWRGKDERLWAELLKRKQDSDLHLSQVLLSDPERKVPRHPAVKPSGPS